MCRTCLNIHTHILILAKKLYGANYNIVMTASLYNSSHVNHLCIVCKIIHIITYISQSRMTCACYACRPVSHSAM